MADDDEPSLNDGDLFGLLELVGHRIQRLAALRAALAVSLVQLVDLVDDRQPELGTGTMPRLGRTRRRRLGGRRALFTRRTEQRAGALRQELLQEGELLLELGAVVAAQARELRQQGFDFLVEALILAIEEAGGLS